MWHRNSTRTQLYPNFHTLIFLPLFFRWLNILPTTIICKTKMNGDPRSRTRTTFGFILALAKSDHVAQTSLMILPFTGKFAITRFFSFSTLTSVTHHFGRLVENRWHFWQNCKEIIRARRICWIDERKHHRLFHADHDAGVALHAIVNLFVRAACNRKCRK